MSESQKGQQYFRRMEGVKMFGKLYDPNERQQSKARRPTPTPTPAANVNDLSYVPHLARPAGQRKVSVRQHAPTLDKRRFYHQLPLLIISAFFSQPDPPRLVAS